MNIFQKICLLITGGAFVSAFTAGFLGHYPLIQIWIVLISYVLAVVFDKDFNFED